MGLQGLASPKCIGQTGRRDIQTRRRDPTLLFEAEFLLLLQKPQFLFLKLPTA